MRKGISTKKLSRTTNERKQLFRNLISSLVRDGFVVTSLAKAKPTQRIAEKLVTKAKTKSLAQWRRLVAEVGNVSVAQDMVKLGELFNKRPGGYTRIIRLDNQWGDNTQTVRLEWVEKMVEAQEVKQPAVTKPIAKVAPAKVEVKKPAAKTTKKTKTKTK